MTLKLNLELEKVIAKIKENNPKTVLIQLPDGLKPKAGDIQDKLKEQFPEIKITFWAGSCYGACDTPNVDNFDLFIAFGHSEWMY
jgi:diphthamide biosynthesis enzyme Dph1/Dph2-like protein